MKLGTVTHCNLPSIVKSKMLRYLIEEIVPYKKLTYIQRYSLKKAETNDQNQLEFSRGFIVATYAVIALVSVHFLVLYFAPLPRWIRLLLLDPGAHFDAYPNLLLFLVVMQLQTVYTHYLMFFRASHSDFTRLSDQVLFHGQSRRLFVYRYENGYPIELIMRKIAFALLQLMQMVVFFFGKFLEW